LLVGRLRAGRGGGRLCTGAAGRAAGAAAAAGRGRQCDGLLDERAARLAKIQLDGGAERAGSVGDGDGGSLVNRAQRSFEGFEDNQRVVGHIFAWAGTALL
jgi:hypothetical protein